MNLRREKRREMIDSWLNRWCRNRKMYGWTFLAVTTFLLSFDATKLFAGALIFCSWVSFFVHGPDVPVLSVKRPGKIVLLSSCTLCVIALSELMPWLIISFSITLIVCEYYFFQFVEENDYDTTTDGSASTSRSSPPPSTV